MIAFLSLIYGSFYFLFFKKLKWFAESVRNISIFAGLGIVMIGAIVFAWWTFAPTSMDGRGIQYVIPIVPNVAGQGVEVPIEGNQPLKEGDVLFKIDPTPYQFKVDQLKASIAQAEAQKKLAEIEVERATGLVKANAGPQSQLDQWIAQLASTNASIASLTGQKAPNIRLPLNLIFPVAWFSEAWARLTQGSEPRVTADGLRMARKLMFFNSEKAQRELGYEPRPAVEALIDAIDWFQAHDYCQRKL